MRNKILVLVLALVCLLSVSAMAESKGEANTVLQAHQMRVIESNYEALVKAGHELALDGASDDRYYAYEGKAVVVVEPKDCEDKTGYAQFICNKTCTKKHDADLWENGWPVTKVSLSADLHTIGASNKDLVEKKANSCLTMIRKL